MLNRSRDWLVRVSGFFAFWMILAGIQPADLAAGLAVALVAATVSLKLLPPGQGRVRPLLLLGFALRFLCQSVAAGVDVARRALHPRLPLRPGFVVYRPQLREGAPREAFCTITSMLPGTLPTDAEPGGSILVHCLDTAQPVAAQLAFEENLLMRACGAEVRDG